MQTEDCELSEEHLKLGFEGMNTDGRRAWLNDVRTGRFQFELLLDEEDQQEEAGDQGEEQGDQAGEEGDPDGEDRESGEAEGDTEEDASE